MLQLCPSTGGNDIITGGAVAYNVLTGDAGSVRDAQSTGGNDTLVGGANSPSNTLVGDFGEVLAGATGGDDRLVSGVNSPDQMWGDFQNVISGSVEGGHDTFVFSANSGNDLVYDFHQGEDIIELVGFDQIKTPGKALDQCPRRRSAKSWKSHCTWNLNKLMQTLTARWIPSSTSMTTTA